MRDSLLGGTLSTDRLVGEMITQRMYFHNIVRPLVALCASAGLVAGVATIASAGTFGVSTNVTASCVVNTAPAALAPTYSGATDASVGTATTLTTTCNGATPTVTFTDPSAGVGTIFTMNGTAHPGNALQFQISNGTSCSGVVGDAPLTQGAAQALTSGASEVYNICAAVIPGQTLTAVDTYNDTVTYTINA